MARGSRVVGRRSWVVVLSITVVGWALTMVVLRRFRSRVSYWV